MQSPSNHKSLLSASMAKAKREKWGRYMKRIEPQIVVLLNHRRWNRVFEAVVNANPRLRPGIPVLDYFRHIYADYAVMAIRRLSKPHPDAISLLELIEDMAANPEALTLEWTIALYGQPLPDGFRYTPHQAEVLARMTFKEFADASGRVFNASIAITDAQRLREATDKILSHVDGVIAHDDKNPPSVRPTFNELDEAIDLIEELGKRYSLLITGASFAAGMTPIDTANSTRVFSFPWIDPEHPPDFLREPL